MVLPLPLRPALALAISTAGAVRSVEADGVGVSWLNHRVVGAVVTVALQICAFC